MMNVCQNISDTPRVMTFLETRPITFTHVLRVSQRLFEANSRILTWVWV